MWNGFRLGSAVRINPGSLTQEDNVLIQHPFILARPLRFMHGLGETVLQISEEDSPQPATRVRPPPAAISEVEQPGAPSAVVQAIQAAWFSLAGYVASRLGWEAAVVFVFMLIGVLCMGGYVVQLYCEYSLCCLHRRGKTSCCWRRHGVRRATHSTRRADLDLDLAAFNAYQDCMQWKGHILPR